MVRYIRMSGLLVLVAAVTIAPVAPVYAQAGQSTQQQQQMGQGTQQQQQQNVPPGGQTVPAQAPEIVVQQPGPPPPPPQPKKFSDSGLKEYSYGKSWFPDVLAPYTQLNVPLPNLVNTPDIDSLIKDGKLVLTLQDAIALALRNNLDIEVQEFNPWIAETSILRGRAIGTVSTFDPTYTTSIGVSTQNTPVTNPFLSGTGTSSLLALSTHSFFVNNTYSQAFDTGTSFQVQLNGSRQLSSSSANLFNPSISTSMNTSVTQQLLRGFGKAYNNRPFYIAKNNKLITDATFKQSVLADVTAVEMDYWELVYARQNVAVGQQVLATAQKLLSDDQKQVEIGTLAPLDVTSAEANVAGARQTLIQDQTTMRQDELVLLSVITKNPISTNLMNIEVVPTDNMYIPEQTENIPLDQAVKEAIANRPDYQEFALALKGDDINIRAAKNELLPVLQLTGTYSWTGLAGIQTLSGGTIPGTFNAELPEPIVNANGTVIANEFVGVPATLPSTTSTTGLGTALGDLFQNKFPTYGATLTFQLPIRNRSAQADSIQSILTQRQDLVKLQQEVNTVVVDVRNTQIVLQQDRAALEAAQATVKYAQDAVDAEEKKLQFGTSTSLAVVQLQQTLALDASALVRAEVNLVEAKVQFDRAMARTFNVNNITVDTARNQPATNPLIPGTMKNGQLYASPFMELQTPANNADAQATVAPATTAVAQPGTPAPKNHDQN